MAITRRRSLFTFWKQDEPDSFDAAERHHVKIHIRWIDFFTPPIVASMLFIASVLIYGHHAILHYFFAGEVPLNCLIVGGIFFAVWRIVMNISTMRDSALVLRDMELLSQQPEIRPEDIDKLHKKISDKGHIIDTKHLALTIDKMAVYGHLAFSDEAARLVKSKIGQRCTHNRTSVGFLAGMLIMMGLLGTYLGLLETIDKVGQAMASMANIGGDSAAPSGDAGLSSAEMSGFIGSIAAPLQGMGLAFSASLFGIGGSLIVSFFNYLSGHAQNDFIENIGRWIDENIPVAGPKAEKAAHASSLPGSADLKPWLASFAQLSQRTHKKLGQLIVVLSHTVRLLINQKNVSDQLERHQGEIGVSLDAIQQHLIGFKEQSHEVAIKSEQHLRNVDNTLNAIAAGAETANDSSRRIADDLKSINGNIATLNTSIKSSSGTIAADIRTIVASIEAQEVISKALAGAIQDLRVGLESFSKTEKEIAGGLSRNIDQLKTIEPVKNEGEIANLIWQLNTILDELAQGNQDKIADLDKQKPQ